MNQTPVECGWKGCENSYATTEGMNIHVQADHMVFRVLMQTEYQGRTHLQETAAATAGAAPAFEQQQQQQRQQHQAAHKQGATDPRSTEEISPPQSPQYEPATQQPRPVITALQPAKASAATVTGVSPDPPEQEVATTPAFARRSAPITMKNEVVEQEEEVVEEELALVPMNVVSSGALIFNPKAQVRMKAAIDTDESQESEGGVGGSTPPPSTASAVKKRERSSEMGGGGATRAKKSTRKSSIYWVYTDHMSYQCRHHRCVAEFSTAETARHHFTSNHMSAALSSSNEEATSSSAAATAGALITTTNATSMSSGKAAPNKRQFCPYAGCRTYFMSKLKLTKHIDVQHGTEIKPMPHDVDEHMNEEEEQLEEDEILSVFERGDHHEEEEELEDEVFQINEHTDNKNNNNGDNDHGDNDHVIVFP